MGVLAKFVLIVSAITLAAGLGYLTRKLRPATERYAGDMMYYLVILGWTPLSVLVIWQIDLQPSLFALPLISFLLPVLMAPVGMGLGRLHHLDSKAFGTYTVACGIANIGVTLGGFVCYALYDLEGLGYAQLYIMPWAISYVGIYYPLARYIGEPGSSVDVRFLLRTFFDRRSLPGLGALIGLALNFGDVPVPAFITDYHIIDIFMVPSVLVSFYCMGLQIHFTSLGEMPRLHGSLALCKFLIAPVITVILVWSAEGLLGSLPPVARKVALIEGFMPTAIFTVVISNLFSLHPRLASVLFLVNTVAFLVVVLPILIVVFG